MQHVAIAVGMPTCAKKIIGSLKQSGDFIIDIIAFDGYELIQKLHSSSYVPDIFVIDINLTIMDGVAINFFLSKYFPLSKIISLSLYLDHAIIHQAIETGAKAYLVQDEAESFILTAIQKIQCGKLYIDPRTKIDVGVLTKDFSVAVIQGTGIKNLPGLSKREKMFIILNATTLGYDQIARLMFVELKTIQTYFDRVAKKCNVRSRQALTLYSLQNRLARVAQFPSYYKE